MGAKQGRDHVEGELAAEASCHPQHLQLALGGKPVARFDLDRGDPFRHQVVETVACRLKECLLGGGACLGDRRADAAAPTRDLLVGRSLEAKLEFLGPVAREDDVRMAVDEARRHPAPAGVDHLARERFGPIGQLGARTDVGDAPLRSRDRAVADGAIGLAARLERGKPKIDPDAVPHRHAVLNPWRACRAPNCRLDRPAHERDQASAVLDGMYAYFRKKRGRSRRAACQQETLCPTCAHLSPCPRARHVASSTAPHRRHRGHQ